MSGTTDLAIAVSSPSSPDRSMKEKLIGSTESAFFDGMLTFAWLSNEMMTVIEVNDALRHWLTANDISELLEKIDDKGVDVEEFLERILHDDHQRVAAIVKGNLEWVRDRIAELDYQKVLQNEGHLLADNPEELYTVQRTIRFASDGTDPKQLSRVLAGVRVVAPGAIRLRSASERDRVDIVSACQIERDGDRWKITGYQGLLQQAWLRVKSNIKAGTQAGTVGLVSRNMSHNIGSHALFYLELDERDKGKKIFFRYMRERMELLAGFATSMPLSSAPSRLKTVIDEFEKNQALLTRIAKSEQVETISVSRDGEDYQIGLPGGALSAQALYSIFENNIRDSAKHGRTRDSQQTEIQLKIMAREPDEPEYREDFIELVVSDNRRNFSDAGEWLRESLNKLRIVDEVGKLEPGDWGIKERFISAALLRGRRLEDIDIQLQQDRGQTVKYSIGDHAPEGEPRILDIRNVDGNIGWVFYLLKPKDILVIGNLNPEIKEVLRERFHDAINIHDFKWLRENVSLPSKVRHRFLVVFPENKDELDQLEKLRDKLPYRVIVSLPKYLELDPFSEFASIIADDFDLTDLSLDKLYQLWVNWLLDCSPRSQSVLPHMRLTRNSRMPQILIQDAGFKALVLDEETGHFYWKARLDNSYRTDREVLLFDRHGHCMRKTPNPLLRQAHGTQVEWKENVTHFDIAHYETYVHSDSLSPYIDSIIKNVGHADNPTESSALGFCLIEAGITRILIVDERLDPASAKQLSYTSDSNWKCSYQELFEKKGIEIRGEEYASHTMPGPELLVRWVRGKNYDFLVLHKGIVDKLIKLDRGLPPREAMQKLFALLREHVRHIVIHSGRMAAGELPEGVKFMSLSNVDTWLKGNRAKVQIVEDLYTLRRP